MHCPAPPILHRDLNLPAAQLTFSAVGAAHAPKSLALPKVRLAFYVGAVGLCSACATNPLSPVFHASMSCLPL